MPTRERRNPIGTPQLHCDVHDSMYTAPAYIKLPPTAFPCTLLPYRAILAGIEEAVYNESPAENHLTDHCGSVQTARKTEELLYKDNISTYI